MVIPVLAKRTNSLCIIHKPLIFMMLRPTGKAGSWWMNAIFRTTSAGCSDFWMVLGATRDCLRRMRNGYLSNNWIAAGICRNGKCGRCSTCTCRLAHHTCRSPGGDATTDSDTPLQADSWHPAAGYAPRPAPDGKTPWRAS